MLKATNISTRFGQDEIVCDVSLIVQPGEITAVIGPSGGGKSTLLRSLSLLDPPTSGTVEIDGHPYEFPGLERQLDETPWPALGVVFQQLFLWPHLTLRQNINLPLELRGLDSRKAEAKDLLDYFELESAADRYPNETSLGQRQRAAFVRAIVLEPRYLLLDEITSALDVEHVAKVLEQLTRLKTEGVGILIVTHLLGFARRAADQVLFLDHGKIVECGGPSILGSPKSDRLRRFLSITEAAN